MLAHPNDVCRCYDTDMFACSGLHSFSPSHIDQFLHLCVVPVGMLSPLDDIQTELVLYRIAQFLGGLLFAAP